MKKNILVFGATGQQGSATTRELSAHGFAVRAFTRNAAGESAQRLGVELFEGDMGKEADLVEAMKDVYGVFLVQPPSWDPTPETDEYEARTGMLITDVAKKSGVQHLVYSSVLGSELQAGFRPLFKFTIEGYIQQSGLPATIFKPASFLENFYLPHFGLPEKRIYNPLPADRSLPFISVEDIGVFARLAFQQPSLFVGKTMNLAGEALTVAEIATFLGVEFGVAITPVQVPVAVVKSQNNLLGQLMEEIERQGYEAIDVAYLRQLHPGLMTTKAWVERYGRKRLAEILNRSC